MKFDFYTLFDPVFFKYGEKYHYTVKTNICTHKNTILHVESPKTEH